jgi:hypothetical protein
MRGSLKKTSAILVGIILSIPLAIFGFFAYQNVATRASDAEPRDVIISKITDSSAMISWTTDQPTQGVVEYGTAPTALVFFAPEAQKVRKHEVELTLLSPKTTHYFQIRVGEETFDNGGVPWTFTTKGTDESPEADATDSAALDQEPTNAAVPTQAVQVSPGEETSPSPAVSPVQSSPTVVPPSPTSAAISCEDETDCQKVLQKLNKGCTTADYVRCIKRSAPTPTYTPVPTSVPEPTEKEPDDISPTEPETEPDEQS